MKNTIKINALTKEITMTNATAKRAGEIGSPEYEQLAKVTRDFPNFTVKILSPKVRENNNKGLTLELMEKLMQAMTINEEVINTFMALKDDYKATNFHFSKPKAYFLSQFPNWREWLPTAEEPRARQEQHEDGTAAVEEQRQRRRFW